ncbi:MAG: hypothetical protein ACXVX9_12240 [Mycobacteriaceae bacterium]
MAPWGAAGSWLITIALPADIAHLMDEEYEWVEEGKLYREWLVPAEILNEHGRVVHVEHDF